MEKEFIISAGIIAYNEENYINNLLNQILSQEYPHNLTELILVDSKSTDATKSIFEKFREEHLEEYKSIIVLDNNGCNQASGWNVVIDNFSGDALIRIDAHTKIPADFIRKNVECLMSGEMVCGGKRPNISENDTQLKNLILLADKSLFGGSFGKYHESEKRFYTDTVFHGCYRKEVIQNVGKFNEKLGRTEDNDFHQRVREAGYKICYDPGICSYQFSRQDIKSAVKQKYGNGYWCGRTCAINPKCISLFHFVPFCFVMAIIFSVILGLVFSWIPTILLGIAYLIADLGLTILSIIAEKQFKIIYLLLPLLFFILHISYGIGTFNGFISILTKNPNKEK